MTCITAAILEKVDERLKKRLEETKALKDHLIAKAGKTSFLIATTESRMEFEGIKPIQMQFAERKDEEIILIIAEKGADYSLSAYRVFADPFNTPSLIEDNRIGDGFIVRAGQTTYDTPKDDFKLLSNIKKGERISAVYRRSGEPSAIMDARMMMARCGPYHPKTEEVLRPFDSKAKKAIKAYVVSFAVNGGKITVDNTFKPKTVKIPKEGI